jgi:hypothetical protein
VTPAEESVVVFLSHVSMWMAFWIMFFMVCRVFAEGVPVTGALITLFIAAIFCSCTCTAYLALRGWGYPVFLVAPLVLLCLLHATSRILPP